MSDNKIVNWFKRVALSVTANVLAVAIGGVIAWITTIVVRNAQVYAEIAVPLGILVGLIATAALIYLWRRLDRYRPHFERLFPEYEVLEKEVMYKYRTETVHVYSKKMRIKALARSVNDIRDKYHWTGSGSVELSSLVSEHSIYKGGSRNVWQLYTIDLGTSLKKGQELDVHVKWDLNDEGRTMSPFISQTVEVPTRVLRFRVIATNLSVKIEDASWVIRPTVDALEQLESGRIEVRDGIIDWEFKRPKLLHCYEVRWRIGV